MKITCGLVIYDELKEIQRLIPQLKSELKDHEVDWIFVLNHEQSEFRLWIKEWLRNNVPGEQTKELTCFENPLNNLGFARQILITHAKTELIYLTDPDIELVRGSLLKLIDCAGSDVSVAKSTIPNTVKIAGYGGTVRHLSTHPFLNRTFDLMGKLSKFFPFSFQIQTHLHPVLVDHLPACHLLLKKSVALQIGGFSYEQPRCGEDTDFTHRAYNLNHRFVFLPSSEVLHWQNVSLAQWYYKVYCFGRAQISVQKKNFRQGIRFYRLLPLLGLIAVVTGMGLSLFFSFSFLLLGLFALVFLTLLNSAFLGFAFVILSYSLGELSELIWPSSELRNEVPLKELEASLTSQFFAANKNN